MAKRKSAEVSFEEVSASAANDSAPFWVKYEKQILYGLGAIAALVAGWFLYKSFVVAPRQKEAVAAMWQAQLQFKRDSFQLALENPGGGFEGFRSIADNYGSTPAGNIARYYAGVCCLHLGDYDEAIRFLEKYSPKDELTAHTRNGMLGDCYAEKKDLSKALSYYEKAVSAGNNELLAAYYLKKVGMLNEYQGNKEAAAKAYERLRRDYPNQSSSDWAEIEKYIYRASGGK